MDSKDIKKYIELEPDARSVIASYSQRLKLSGRAYHRVLKLARTISDLKGNKKIDTESILEAIQYRPKR